MNWTGKLPSAPSLEIGDSDPKKRGASLGEVLIILTLTEHDR